MSNNVKYFSRLIIASFTSKYGEIVTLLGTTTDNDGYTVRRESTNNSLCWDSPPLNRREAYVEFNRLLQLEGAQPDTLKACDGDLLIHVLEAV